MRGGTEQWITIDDAGNSVAIVHYDYSGEDHLVLNGGDSGAVFYPLTPSRARFMAAALSKWADDRDGATKEPMNV